MCVAYVHKRCRYKHSFSVFQLIFENFDWGRNVYIFMDLIHGGTEGGDTDPMFQRCLPYRQFEVVSIIVTDVNSVTEFLFYCMLERPIWIDRITWVNLGSQCPFLLVYVLTFMSTKQLVSGERGRNFNYIFKNVSDSPPSLQPSNLQIQLLSGGMNVYVNNGHMLCIVLIYDEY